MNCVNFIIVLILFLIIFFIFNKNENFNSNIQNLDQTLDQKSNKGLYNWFYQSNMNPYSLPLTKFFTNDKEGEVNLIK